MKKGILIFSIIILVFLLTKSINRFKPATSKQPSYVGTEKCQSCHQQAYKEYITSDHFHAMDSAVSNSVKGDFNNSFFVYYGDTSFFYKHNDRFYVKTLDSTGHYQDFEISYTFGWNPLQQYLVKFSDGKIQSLPFCWDTRPKDKGGQRWFHLYNKENIRPDDELFWMGINHNWNYMCADCHTTNYKTNFDVGSNTFHSNWVENKVSCESCHGPASGHIDWTADKDSRDTLKGFVSTLAGKKIQWIFNKEKGIAYPNEVSINTTLIETCARCHARAIRFSDDYQHGQSFLQTHLPSMIDSNIYFMDGQIKEEDYEYGSFLQSKMYANGVNCVNCHNPHTGRILATGNQVCSSCHSPEKFDTPTHTHHMVNSTGAQCVNCHMPVTTYMVVDERRDHSFRIPRPDLSTALGTPNACNKCHTNKPVSWSADNFSKWYGDKLSKTNTYGQLLSLISKREKGSEAAMYELLTSNLYPAIIKSTALHQYNHYFSKRIIDQNKNFLLSSDARLRLSALQAISGLPENVVMTSVLPLLNDPIRMVRMEALSTIAPYYTKLDEGSKRQFETVMNEYMAIQTNMSHRPEGFLNRGILLMSIGKIDEAEQLYLMGISRFPKFIPMYINLADLYRAKSYDANSKIYLDKGLQINPSDAFLQYTSGLWYIRNKNQVEGMAALKKAIRLAPQNPTFVYAYAIGLYSTGDKARAFQLLEKFITGGNNDPLIFDGLISIYKDTNNSERADYYLKMRNEIFPGY